MNSNIFLRRVTTATVPARSIATTASSPLSPWINRRPCITRNNYTNKTTLSHRPFSHTTPSSSPFRLSSNNNNTTNSYEEGEIDEDNPLARYSQYKPKRQWPPDMNKLSPKHQFRLERKYRRRAALKFARPGWTKGTKLVQWGAIMFTVIYAVLFMPWADEGSPFEDLRQAIFTGTKAAFSSPPPPGPMKKSGE